MADMNRGPGPLGLRDHDGCRIDQFRSFYRDKLGTPHRGLKLLARRRPAGRAEAVPRIRGRRDAGRPGDGAQGRRVQLLRVVRDVGYAAGVRYLVRMHQSMGFRRSQILEGLAMASLHNGPRGSETVAEALDGYEWITPAEPAVFFDGWAPDPGCVRVRDGLFGARGARRRDGRPGAELRDRDPSAGVPDHRHVRPALRQRGIPGPGGPRRDEHTRILTPFGQPISGLYGAGDGPGTAVTAVSSSRSGRPACTRRWRTSGRAGRSRRPGYTSGAPSWPCPWPAGWPGGRHRGGSRRAAGLR
jgi:hypothetical protein